MADRAIAMDSGGHGGGYHESNPPELEIFEPEEEFDAFNDDTFGNAAETWAEEDHEHLVGSHFNEVRTFVNYGTNVCAFCAPTLNDQNA